MGVGIGELLWVGHHQLIDRHGKIIIERRSTDRRLESHILYNLLVWCIDELVSSCGSKHTYTNSTLTRTSMFVSSTMGNTSVWLVATLHEPNIFHNWLWRERSHSALKKSYGVGISSGLKRYEFGNDWGFLRGLESSLQKTKWEGPTTWSYVSKLSTASSNDSATLASRCWEKAPFLQGMYLPLKNAVESNKSKSNQPWRCVEACYPPRQCWVWPKSDTVPVNLDQSASPKTPNPYQLHTENGIWFHDNMIGDTWGFLTG